MSESFRDLPRALKIYDLVVICAPLTLSIWAIPHSHLSIVVWLSVIFTAACAVRPIPHPYGGIIHPISGIIQVAGLMWQPQDILLGVGIGCFVGLLVFQKPPLSKAAANAAGWAAGAMVAAAIAQLVLIKGQFGLLSVPVAASLSVVGRFVANQVLFSIFRSLRFGYPFLSHLRLCLGAYFLAELFPLPMIVILASAGLLLKTVVWSLLLTAAYLLVLPVPRSKAKECLKSRELVGEAAEDAMRTLSQSEETGSFTHAIGGSLQRIYDTHPTPLAFGGLASAGPLARYILPVAEVCANMRVAFGSIPRSVSYEDIEHEFKRLTGANPDPDTVQILMSFVGNEKSAPLSRA